MLVTLDYDPELSDSRRKQLEELTDVTITIIDAPPVATSEPYKNTMEPTFGTLDPQFFDEAYRPVLLNMLKQGVVLVGFITADGVKKTMRCTMDEKHIPEAALPKKIEPVFSTLVDLAFTPNPADVKLGGPNAPKPKKAPDQNLFKVYSLDANGWRSFRFERVTHYALPA